MSPESHTEEEWRDFLSNGETIHRRVYHLFGMLPSSPRCKACNAPFTGPGSILMRAMGKRQSKNNPRFCDPCEGISQHPGGAEVELTMLFADVRGSTTLAEQMRASEYSQLIQRFYVAATDILVQTDALIDKFVGDGVIALYIPGFAGPQHARKAIDAAQRLLRATGYGTSAGPWLPIGVGVHTGVAFVGAVKAHEGMDADVTALGDNVNIAARLVALARPGEILASDATCAAAGLDIKTYEHRQLDLKGKSHQIGVRVLRAATAEPVPA